MGYLSCKAESSIAVSDSSSDDNKPIKIQQFDYRDLVAATNGFSDQKLLGKGSHGYVYKAVLHGRLVAVKRPSIAAYRSHHHHLLPKPTNEVDNEIEILSKLHSPRLVNLVGFSDDSKDRLLVVEFMSNGTLYDVLHYCVKSPSWGRRIQLALQTAKAVDILHSSFPPVIHRDIKSANVLIDRSYNARLGDFGLALRCHLNDYKLLLTPPAGTMGYLDPCYVTPDNVSTKSDVFSFGILLLEIISGRKAIDVAFLPPSVVDWAIPLIKRGKLLAVYDPRILPPVDPVVRKQLAVIAAKCVRSCRERRPTIKQVVVWLRGLSKLVPLHLWNNFNNPCMMVETMGQPVESKASKMNLKPHGFGDEHFQIMEVKLAGQALRNSRRVYSDLGFSSNLMELMAGTDEESEFQGKRDGSEPVSKPVSRVSRFSSTRYLSRGSNQSTPSNGREVPHLNQNHSFGPRSFICSKRDDTITNASSDS